MAPWKSCSLPLAGPRASEPHTGWPPMKRTRSDTASQRADLVEPTSVTVAPSPAAASTSPIRSPSVATGVATTTRSASSTAATRLPTGSSTAPRSAATARNSGSAS